MDTSTRIQTTNYFARHFFYNIWCMIEVLWEQMADSFRIKHLFQRSLHRILRFLSQSHRRYTTPQVWREHFIDLSRNRALLPVAGIIFHLRIRQRAQGQTNQSTTVVSFLIDCKANCSQTKQLINEDITYIKCMNVKCTTQ